jgi:hypothetical protein
MGQAQKNMAIFHSYTESKPKIILMIIIIYMIVKERIMRGTRKRGKEKREDEYVQSTLSLYVSIYIYIYIYAHIKYSIMKSTKNCKGGRGN